MKLTRKDRRVMLDALDNHRNVVEGWDNADDAKIEYALIDELNVRLREPWRDPKAHTCLPGHQPGMEDMECECWPTFGDNDSPIPAGICIRDESSGIYVMRCDQCSIFSTDAAAADFLASILGDVPWQKDFVESATPEEIAFMTVEQLAEHESEEAQLAADKIERRYEPFFPMPLDEFYRYLAGYYNAMESRCYRALKLPLPEYRRPPKPGTLGAAMHAQVEKFETETTAHKASVESSTLDALRQANERLAERDATIARLVDEVDKLHATPPPAVRVEEASALTMDGLRGALVLLRNAIDDEEVADHIPSDVLSVVDLIIDRTED